jgi:hypothetical protein
MNQVIKRAVALISVIAAFAVVSAPAASARVDVHPAGYSQASQQAASAPTAPVSTGSASSFDWGDAAIGAGVMLAIVALAGGAVLLSRRGQLRGRPATTS